MSLGLNKGDRVALISEGRNDWVMSEIGILYCGAINVPISVKIDEPSDLKFRLTHSGLPVGHRLAGPGGEDPEDQERPSGAGKDHRPGRAQSLRGDEISAAEVLRSGDAS